MTRNWRNGSALALLACGLWLSTGCGGAAASAPSRRETVASPAGGATSGSDATAQSTTGAESAPQSETPSRARPATMPGTTTAAPSATSPYATPTGVGVAGSSGDRMTYWVGRLDQASSVMSSSGECRDICRANGDICTAAHEICVLTGDGEATSPTDGRCSRARTACEQATRQRNGACRVCPSE